MQDLLGRRGLAKTPGCILVAHGKSFRVPTWYFEEQPLSLSFYSSPAFDLFQGQCEECFYPLE